MTSNSNGAGPGSSQLDPYNEHLNSLLLNASVHSNFDKYLFQTAILLISSMHSDDWDHLESNVATPQFIPQTYTDNGKLDDGDKSNLQNHGAKVYDSSTALLAGTRVRRAGTGNCLFHSLLETDNTQLAAEMRTTLATFIHANEHRNIGNYTFIQSIH